MVLEVVFPVRFLDFPFAAQKQNADDDDQQNSGYELDCTLGIHKLSS